MDEEMEEMMEILEMALLRNRESRKPLKKMKRRQGGGARILRHQGRRDRVAKKERPRYRPSGG